MIKKYPIVSLFCVAIILGVGTLTLVKNTDIYTQISGNSQLAAVAGAGSGLIAHWTFDEASGETVNDVAGAPANTGTIIGSPVRMQSGAAVGSGAMTFTNKEGAQASVNVGRVMSSVKKADESGTNQISVSAWIKREDPSYQYTEMFVSKQSNANAAWALYKSHSLVFSVFSLDGGFHGVSAQGPLFEPANTEWAHVVGVYNGEEVVLYLNGEAGTPVPMTGNIHNYDVDTCISASSDAGCAVSGFTGSMDDVRIYNRALTETEVMELCNMKSGGCPPAPIPPVGGVDTIRPKVTITAPLAETTISGHSFSFNADATDAGGVLEVDFKVDGILIETATTEPYSISLNTFALSQGTHTFQAVARDASNNRATSTVAATVSNSVDGTAPSISQVASTSLTSSATISWATNEVATSWIQYGLTPSTLDSSTVPGREFALTHSQKITRLSANTIYHYKIFAKDPSGNIGERSGTFRTRAKSDTAQNIDGSALVKFPTSALWSHDVNFKPGNGERIEDVNPPRFSWLYNLDPLVSNCSAASYGCVAWAPKRFVFQIARDANFSNLLVDEMTEFNFYNFIPVLPTETPLYWRVGYILPKNTSDPYTWTMQDDSYAAAPYAYSSVKTFTIAANATPWDRSMLGENSYMNNPARTAHPHIFFNTATRGGLYTWLEEMENAHLTTGTPQEKGIAQAWKTMKDNAKTFESQLTKSDLALNAADMRVQFAKIGPSPGVDFDEVLPKMIQKEYVSPNLYASSQNRNHAFDAEFQGWFPQYDTSAVGTSSSVWSAKLAVDGINFSDVSVLLVQRGYMKEADGKYWVKTKLVKDGFDAAFKSSLPAYSEEKFTKLKSTLLSLYSSPFDEMRLIILRSYYNALGKAATPLSGNMRDEPGLDGIQAIALVWQLTKSATDAEGIALNKHIEGKHFEDVSALVAEWFLESKQWAMDTQVSGDPILNRHLGYAYDWFYDELTEAQRQTFRRAIDANIAYTSGEVPGHPIYDRYAKPAKENNSVFYIDPSWSLYRFGASHLAGNSEAAIVGALATYGESPKARRYLDFMSNYIIGQTAFTGSSGDMGMGRGYAVGVFFGGGGAGYRYLIDNFMLQIAFPEAGFNKNPFWKTSAEWWSRTTPVGFTQSHEPWGDGEGKRVSMLADPTMARDLAYFTNDGKMLRHYLNERVLLRGTEPSLESFDQLPILYYAQKNLKGLKVPVPQDNTVLSKLFDYSGWGTGCSAPVNTPDCFLNGVGFEMKASPANHLGVGSNTHTNYAGLSYQLWAYGVPITDAGQDGLVWLSKMSEDHYSIMVDGVGMYQEPFLPNEAVLGRFTAYATSSDYVYFAADATAAYARKSSSNPPFDNSPHKQLKKVQRHFLFVKNKYFVVFDDVESAKDSKFSWLYQVPALYRQVGGSSYTTTKHDLFTQDSPTSFSYTAGNTPFSDYTYSDFEDKEVRVKVALINDPANIIWQDMNGADQRKNPITGRDQTTGGDGRPRSRTIWVSNKEDSKKFNFMSVIYPQKPGEIAPTITRINDYTARVINADGTVDVISFDPDTAVENGATIVIDVEDLAPDPIVDDVGSAYIPPEPPQPSTKSLTIRKQGAGAGTINGNVLGIACSLASCPYSGTVGTRITLTAAPVQNSTFIGWSGGGCSGTGSCSFTLSANTTVTGTFNTSGIEEEDPLVMTDVSASSVAARSALVTWTTNVPATSVVEYGLTTSYGNTTVTGSASLTHSHTVSFLKPNTTYNFKVVSTDLSNNATSSRNYTFTTPKFNHGDLVTIGIDVTKENGGVSTKVLPKGSEGEVVAGPTTVRGFKTWTVVFNTDLQDICPLDTTTCYGIEGWGTYSYDDRNGEAPKIQETFLTMYKPAVPQGGDVTPPVITLTSPANSGTISLVGKMGFSLAATARDESTAATVQFYVNSLPYGDLLTAEPFARSLNTPGTYTVYATARDAAGNTATTPSRTFTLTTSAATPTVVDAGGGTTVVTRGATPTPVPPPAPVAPAVVAPNAKPLQVVATSTSKTLTPTPIVTPEVIPAATTPTATALTRTLTSGTKGAEVESLQKVLKAQGYLSEITGVYDSKTVSALKVFQWKYNLAVPGDKGYGTTDEKTRTKVNALMKSLPTSVTTSALIEPSKPVGVPVVTPVSNTVFKRNLSVGSSGADVKALQVYLNTNGFKIATSGTGSPGKESTYFGEATKAALIKFQKAKGISPASGIFGEKTMAVVGK